MVVFVWGRLELIFLWLFRFLGVLGDIVNLRFVFGIGELDSLGSILFGLHNVLHLNLSLAYQFKRLLQIINCLFHLPHSPFETFQLEQLHDPLSDRFSRLLDLFMQDHDSFLAFLLFLFERLRPTLNLPPVLLITPFNILHFRS